MYSGLLAHSQKPHKISNDSLKIRSQPHNSEISVFCSHISPPRDPKHYVCCVAILFFFSAFCLQECQNIGPFGVVVAVAWFCSFWRCRQFSAVFGSLLPRVPECWYLLVFVFFGSKSPEHFVFDYILLLSFSEF